MMPLQAELMRKISPLPLIKVTASSPDTQWRWKLLGKVLTSARGWPSVIMYPLGWIDRIRQAAYRGFCFSPLFAKTFILCHSWRAVLQLSSRVSVCREMSPATYIGRTQRPEHMFGSVQFLCFLESRHSWHLQIRSTYSA